MPPPLMRKRPDWPPSPIQAANQMFGGPVSPLAEIRNPWQRVAAIRTNFEPWTGLTVWLAGCAYSRRSIYRRPCPPLESLPAVDCRRRQCSPRPGPITAAAATTIRGSCSRGRDPSRIRIRDSAAMPPLPPAWPTLKLNRYLPPPTYLSTLQNISLSLHVAFKEVNPCSNILAKLSFLTLSLTACGLISPQIF